MKILIDSFTGKVAGVNNTPAPSQYEISLPDNFSLTKTIEVTEGEKQKVNEQGQKLYKTNVIASEAGEETFEETAEEKTATKFEERQVTNKWTDEEGVEYSETVTAQVPVEWLYNQPVMLPNVIQKVVTFAENPYEFDASEVAGKKFELITGELGFTYCYADEFLTEEDLDLEAPDHSANTGTKVLELLPNGQCQTAPITLDKEAQDFILYLEADPTIEVQISDDDITFVPFANSLATLATPTSEVILRFKNLEAKKAKVEAYGIFYN
jgi:hypothetical protein